jgi:hypothetical protein
MPWSGTGTYALPPAYSPEVNGTVIDAARYNGLTSDIATGLTAALAKNGENVPTANLPMGGFKHTGAADASAAGQYLTFGSAVAYGFPAGLVGTPGLFVTGDTNTGFWAPAADTLAISTAGAERWRVSSAGLHTWNTAAVGVSGGANWTFGGVASPLMSLLATGGVEGFWGAAAATEVFAGSFSNHPFSIRTNNSQRINILGAGNVAINAPSSGNTLDVETLGNTDFGLVVRNDAGLASRIAIAGNATVPLTSAFEFSQDAASVAQIVQRANAALQIFTNGIERMNVAAGGAVSLLTPTSGQHSIAMLGSGYLEITNAGASGFIRFRDGATDRAYVGTGAAIIGSAAAADLGLVSVTGNILFAPNSALGLVLTTDGRLYGTALHNNAGAVTGTTNQYIASGTYTPSESHNGNITSLTVRPAQWIRVGNVVTVTGGLESVVSNTGGGNTSNVSLTLPIASSLANFWELAGTCSIVDIVGSTNGSVTAQTALDRASLSISITTAATYNWSYTYSYVVL